MRLINKPGSIIGKTVYFEGYPSCRRIVVSVDGGYLNLLDKDGSTNGGWCEWYTFEPNRNALRLTLQDLEQ